MVNINSKSQARRKVREAQARANEERALRERDNVEDAATIMVERGRILGVDAWEAERRDQVQAEADRRREEHRMAAATAVVRMQQRGESSSSIAALADTTVAEVRALLKFAPTERAACDVASEVDVVAAAAATGNSNALGGAGVDVPASDALGLDVMSSPGGDVGPGA